MTKDQFNFLVNGFVPEDEAEYFELGMTCYEDGYMDNFGFLTPKANKEIVDYDNGKRTPTTKEVRQPLQKDGPVKADNNPARE